MQSANQIQDVIKRESVLEQPPRPPSSQRRKASAGLSCRSDDNYLVELENAAKETQEIFHIENIHRQ